MGLFDKYREYKKSRQEKHIAKYAKIITKPKAIKEDRQVAIEYFRTFDDPNIAVPALLQRFEYSLEHGINDTREKENCMEGVTRHKEKALPHVKTHLQVTTRIAWPIKILKELCKSNEEVRDVLLGCLNYGDVAFDQAIVDKNYDILCYLAEYKIPNSIEKLGHFLQDPDERVRFACAEVLVEQEDDHLADVLEPFLSDESAENLRIRQIAIDIFLKKQWVVKNREPFIENQVTMGITINKKGQLTARH